MDFTSTSLNIMNKKKHLSFDVKRMESVFSILNHMVNLSGSFYSHTNYLILIDDLKHEFLLYSLNGENEKKDSFSLYEKLEFIRKVIFSDLEKISQSKEIRQVQKDKAATLWAQMICQVWGDE